MNNNNLNTLEIVIVNEFIDLFDIIIYGDLSILNLDDLNSIGIQIKNNKVQLDSNQWKLTIPHKGYIAYRNNNIIIEFKENLNFEIISLKK